MTRTRQGFSLVEVMIGMTLLAISLTSVARLDYNVMRRSNEVARATYGNASLIHQVNRFVAIDFDSLSTHAGCLTTTTPPTPNTVCATVTDVSAGVKRVTIVLQLTGVPATPDTVIVQRASGTSGNPFNTGP
jgi:prepilin-type N-terminal cleavage/methylation domain-containing protein